MSNRLKKVLKAIVIVILALCVLFAASFIPTFYMHTGGMQKLDGNWITVFYEKQEEAAKDVFTLAELEAQRLTQKLGFSQKQDLEMYIYDKQSTFQTKKYGLLALLLNLNWYIGDNRGSTVLLASPAEVSNSESYERRKTAAPHEMVHALNSILNPQMSLWMNEGAALYLTNGKPPSDLFDTSTIPTPSQMDTSNPVAFSNMGGYYFAHTYVEFLDKTYGWAKVLTLLKTGDYVSSTGKTKLELYDEWLGFLKTKYSAKK